MQKIKKILLPVIIVGSTSTASADTFQQNAFLATGAALAIGSVHLLCKRVGHAPQKQYYAYDFNADFDPLATTRTKSFRKKRSRHCSDESPDFYVESKRIITRTAGVLGLLGGLYIIVNGKEILGKFDRAQTAFTWIGYWDNFKNWVNSFFTA